MITLTLFAGGNLPKTPRFLSSYFLKGSGASFGLPSREKALGARSSFFCVELQPEADPPLAETAKPRHPSPIYSETYSIVRLCLSGNEEPPTFRKRAYVNRYYMLCDAAGGPRLSKPQSSNFKFQNKTQIPNPKNQHLNLRFWICFGF